MTQAIAGFGLKMYVKAPADASYVTVGEGVNYAPSFNATLIDASNYDSSGWEELIAGLNRGTISLEANYIDADPGQVKIHDSYFAKTLLNCRFRVEEASGKKQLTGDARIESFDIAPPVNDKVTISFTLRTTGVWAKSTQ